MTNVKIRRKDVLSEREIDDMITKADKLPHEYFRLRAKAISSIFRRTGKRRREVATLEMDDIMVKGKNLSITFTVVKKRKKSVSSRRREKQIPLSDKCAKYIMEYWSWMKKYHPECKYLFPRIHSVFGTGLAFYEDKHISGRHILRIIKQLNPNAWCHLFRETVGAEAVKTDPPLIGVFKAMMRLDL
ncbi:MAG: tyrosine-type recombinase/integrase [Candidatus Bathyarchaeia archaeon]